MKHNYYEATSLSFNSHFVINEILFRGACLGSVLIILRVSEFEYFIKKQHSFINFT